MTAAVLRVCSGGQWRSLFGAVSIPTRPSAPFVVGVTPGDGQVTVQWLPPVNTGGSAILDFTVALSTGGSSTVSAATTSSVISSPNGTPVTATVTSRNAQGSTTSAASASVTPASTPGFVKRTRANTGLTGVGLTSADLTAHDGSPFTVPGATIVRKIINNPVINADNVTFQECILQAPAGNALYVVGFSTTAPVGTAMVDCDILGNGVPGATADDPGKAPSALFKPGLGWTATRCYGSGSTDLIKPQGGTILAYRCCFEKPVQTWIGSGLSHNDGVQTAGAGASGVTFRQSTIDVYRPGLAYPWGSSVAQFGSFPLVNAAKVAVIQDYVFEDCFLDGATYGFHFGKLNGAAVVQNLKVSGCRFGAHFKAAAADGATAAADGGLPVWVDNVWYQDGLLDNGKTVLAGQLIP